MKKLFIILIASFLLFEGCSKSEQNKTSISIIAGIDFAAIIDEDENLTELIRLTNENKDISGNGYKTFAQDRHILSAITNEGNFITSYPVTADEMQEDLSSAIDKGEIINLGAGTAAKIDIARRLEQETGIKQIICDYFLWFIALKMDGNIISEGIYNYDFEGWTDIQEIAAGNGIIVGLKKDGTVCWSWSGVPDLRIEKILSDWTDISSIYYGSSIFGLKSDGTVVTTGIYPENYVTEWKDIVRLSVTENTTVGLKGDGTVVAVSSIDFGQCDVKNWTDIIAVDTSYYYTLGLKSNGTYIVTKYTGSNENVWVPDVGIINLNY